MPGARAGPAPAVQGAGDLVRGAHGGALGALPHVLPAVAHVGAAPDLARDRDGHLLPVWVSELQAESEDGGIRAVRRYGGMAVGGAACPRPFPYGGRTS